MNPSGQNSEQKLAETFQVTASQNFEKKISQVTLPTPPTTPPTKKISGEAGGGREVAPAHRGTKTPMGKISKKFQTVTSKVTPSRRWGSDDDSDTPMFDGEEKKVEGTSVVGLPAGPKFSPRKKPNTALSRKIFDQIPDKTPVAPVPQKTPASLEEDLTRAPVFDHDGKEFDPAFFAQRSDLSSPEKKKRPLLGVVCISEMTLNGTVLVWAENKLFYRLKSEDFLRVPKPLTPVFFEAESFFHARKIGKIGFPTYVGNFQRLAPLQRPPSLSPGFSPKKIKVSPSSATRGRLLSDHSSPPFSKTSSMLTS